MRTADELEAFTWHKNPLVNDEKDGIMALQFSTTASCPSDVDLMHYNDYPDDFKEPKLAEVKKHIDGCWLCKSAIKSLSLDL